MVFLSGEGQPVLARHPLSQPTNTRASTAMAALIPPMQPPSQLDPSGGVSGSVSEPSGDSGGGGLGEGGGGEGDGGGGEGDGGGGEGGGTGQAVWQTYFRRDVQVPSFHVSFHLPTFMQSSPVR